MNTIEISRHEIDASYKDAQCFYYKKMVKTDSFLKSCENSLLHKSHISPNDFLPSIFL